MKRSRRSSLEENEFRHSNSYHNFFQGYAEQKVPKSNGRGNKIERIYVADYYKYQETELVWYLKKIVNFVLYLIAALGVIYADTRSLQINNIFVLGIMQTLSSVPFIYLLYMLIWNVTAPRRMTIGEVKSSSTGFRRAAFSNGVWLLLVAIVEMVVKWLFIGNMSLEEWRVIALKIISSGVLFSLYIMEKKRPLEKIINESIMPNGANEIW